ncbi:MAG: Tryptophan synthase alpha chain [Spirochaetes bacterium ADurb.Bin218]|jgi:tryptophan synthase alpha chain|nr:tryptophan synthase subunit alpha [Spirochaetota bacterium]OQA97751.1 MAG: Tryptophan synthase alpha chain [Spirochaetes bacterium ADurb.Bin218]HOQ12301.1 tryptophan synthase subunit alpha [Spirochaetota bacterium]HOV09341.1 tryptophan synthase subunit alpha [Spirochaetota bacterium]HPX91636.1 tryptophan synthase subunit alpha [Spirochaetota bacterium]
MKNKYNGFYLMGNYPDRETFIKSALEGLRYFDFIEVGIPFSDPIADGEVISDAAQFMIEKNEGFAEISKSIEYIREHSDKSKDIYLMTYSNLIYNMNMKDFNDFCTGVNIKGLILPDVPFCEQSFIRQLNLDDNIALINFLTPESTQESLEEITSEAKGFIYFISMRGITGSKFTMEDETVSILKKATSLSNVPVVTGFGIKSKEDAKMALNYSDGFITGTALIEALKEVGFDSFKSKLREFFE